MQQGNWNILQRITIVGTKQNAAAPFATLASGIIYQPLSRLVQSMTYGNGLSDLVTHSLDYEVGRCQLLDGAVTVADRSYTRGDALNITGITDNVTAGNSQTFGYTVANRLSAATGPYGGYAWGYDGVGNRTTETAAGVTDTYVYPGTSNRIQSITGL